jgi:hypothetical protein
MFRFLASAAVLAGPLVAAAAAAPASGATAGDVRCGPGFKWDDFTSIAITVRVDAGKAPGPTTVRAAISRYSDGQRLVVDDGDRHGEVIALDLPTGHVTLASDPQAPLQLAEIGMIFDIPLASLQAQFPDPCALAPGVRYPLTARPEWPHVSGEFERTGAAIRFTIREAGDQRQLAHGGTITYEPVRPRLPADLPIQGWSVFRASIRPEDATTTPARMLGEFEDSLKTGTR